MLNNCNVIVRCDTSFALRRFRLVRELNSLFLNYTFTMKGNSYVTILRLRPPPRASSVQRQGYSTAKHKQLAQELTGYIEQLNKGEQGADLRNKVEDLFAKVGGYARALNSIVRNGLELSEVVCLEIPRETNEAQMDAYDKAFDESIDSYKEIFPEETTSGDYFNDYGLEFYKSLAAQYEILKLRVQSQLDRLK